MKRKTIIFLIFICYLGISSFILTENKTTISINKFYPLQSIKIENQKKSDLIKMIGEHKLNSISGLTGANTLFEYVKINNKWTATESSLSMYSRETYKINLTKDELMKLQSMKIVVSNDLSVSLFCNNLEYIKIPFVENGMSYFLKKPAKDYGSIIPENLNPSSSYIDEFLYLYAKDDLNDIQNINITNVPADAILLKFDIKKKEFILVQFYGECCDQASYIFK